MRVILSPQALADLADIGAFIGIDNPERAGTYVEELREVCRQLGTFPRRFPRFPRLGSHAHQRGHGNYLILYDVGEDVNVLAVVHGARNLDDLF